MKGSLTMKRIWIVAALVLAMCYYTVSAQEPAQWSAVYRTASGELISTGTTVGGDLAAQGLASVVLSGSPDFGVQRWNTTTRALEAIPPVVNRITPLVTKTQARDALKALLETPPANWTATQEKQAQYLILLFAFKDFKDGNVY